MHNPLTVEKLILAVSLLPVHPSYRAKRLLAMTSVVHHA